MHSLPSSAMSTQARVDKASNSLEPPILTRSATNSTAALSPLSCQELYCTNLLCTDEHVHKQFWREVLVVLQTMVLLNPTYYVRTHKSTNRTSSNGIVPDVGDPTGAFQMTLSKRPHLSYGSHHFVLELWHEKLVAQNPELQEFQNLIEICLYLLAR